MIQRGVLVREDPDASGPRHDIVSVIPSIVARSRDDGTGYRDRWSQPARRAGLWRLADGRELAPRQSDFLGASPASHRARPFLHAPVAHTVRSQGGLPIG